MTTESARSALMSKAGRHRDLEVCLPPLLPSPFSRSPPKRSAMDVLSQKVLKSDRCTHIRLLLNGSAGMMIKAVNTAMPLL